jgi:hypothetical protein
MPFTWKVVMDFLEQWENNTALFKSNKVFPIGKYKLTCIKKIAMNKEMKTCMYVCTYVY